MSDTYESVASKRRWPVSEKRRIVELTLRKNTSVRDIAKQFSLDPPTLSSWRTQYRQGKLVETSLPQAASTAAFMPVTVTDPHNFRPALTSPMRARIDLPCGASLRIEAATLNFHDLGTLLALVRK